MTGYLTIGTATISRPKIFRGKYSAQELGFWRRCV